ncbi:MAG: hypothetical protein AABZ47_07620 [Planctomycetota bacterium]
MTFTILSASLLWIVTSVGGGDAAFIPLRDLQDDYWAVYPSDISLAGTFVVGRATRTIDDRSEAILWNNGQFQGLGDLPTGDFSSQAAAVSLDGRTVVGIGNVTNDNGDNIGNGFVWFDGLMTSLGELSPNAITPDGNIVVGGRGSGYGDSVVFHWNRSAGEIIEVSIPNYDYTRAEDVSEDGNFVVVSAQLPSSSAFRWRIDENSIEPLGVLLGGTQTNPTAISVDGSVIVGTGGSYSN